MHYLPVFITFSLTDTYICYYYLFIIIHFCKVWILFNLILNFNANKPGMGKQIYNASTPPQRHTLYTVRVECKSPCRGVRWYE